MVISAGFPPGSVVLVEDTTGKGHITRHPAEGKLVVNVAPEDLS